MHGKSKKKKKNNITKKANQMKFNKLYLIYAFTEAQQIGLSVHNEATVLVMH